jgi:flagellar biosynthesis/type III secretory pathway protein FliH
MEDTWAELAKKSIEVKTENNNYCKGYTDGFKEGYQQAFEQFNNMLSILQKPNPVILTQEQLKNIKSLPLENI